MVLKLNLPWCCGLGGGGTAPYKLSRGRWWPSMRRPAASIVAIVFDLAIPA